MTTARRQACEQCSASFGMFRWRHLCTRCSRTVCARCSDRHVLLPERVRVFDFSVGEMCVTCNQAVAREVAADPALRLAVDAYKAGYDRGYAIGVQEGRQAGNDRGKGDDHDVGKRASIDGYARS